MLSKRSCGTILPPVIFFNKKKSSQHPKKSSWNQINFNFTKFFLNFFWEILARSWFEGDWLLVLAEVWKIAFMALSFDAFRRVSSRQARCSTGAWLGWKCGENAWGTSSRHGSNLTVGLENLKTPKTKKKKTKKTRQNEI